MMVVLRLQDEGWEFLAREQTEDTRVFFWSMGHFVDEQDQMGLLGWEYTAVLLLL